MAIAAKVSMMMFTHRICTTVSGMSVPNTAPTKQIRIAAKLIVSWNSYETLDIAVYDAVPTSLAVAIEAN